jgi:hypothetical protein
MQPKNADRERCGVTLGGVSPSVEKIFCFQFDYAAKYGMPKPDFAANNDAVHNHPLRAIEIEKTQRYLMERLTGRSPISQEDQDALTMAEKAMLQKIPFLDRYCFLAAYAPLLAGERELEIEGELRSVQLIGEGEQTFYVSKHQRLVTPQYGVLYLVDEKPRREIGRIRISKKEVERIAYKGWVDAKECAKPREVQPVTVTQGVLIQAELQLPLLPAIRKCGIRGVCCSA